jgi:osmotically-inducible protein OsmY
VTEATVTRRFTIRRALVVIAAVTVTVSCATSPAKLPPQPAFESVRYDEFVANAVYAALSADPTYYYRHVDVGVVNGVASLSGFVWTTDAIYRARQIASQTPGVTRVVTTQLELERNGRNNGVTR